MALPVIDLSGFASDALATAPGGAVPPEARLIDEALCETGFLLVRGHGMDRSVRDEFFVAMKSFFDLPLPQKEALSIANSSCHRGYVGLETEALEGAVAGSELRCELPVGDLKETLDSGIEHGPDHPEVRAATPLHGPNQLPDLPGFYAAWSSYQQAAIQVALRVQRGLALALSLDPDFFESQPGETMFHLRMLHYPALDRLAPEPGQVGCGTHTDYGTITVLADDAVAGLQVQMRSGEWIEVEVPDDLFVVNIGDLMATWTADRWVSNPHRVVNPPSNDRYSAALFVTPPFHLCIETLPTCRGGDGSRSKSPVVSGPYLVSRFDGTHSYRND